MDRRRKNGFGLEKSFPHRTPLLQYYSTLASTPETGDRDRDRIEPTLQAVGEPIVFDAHRQWIAILEDHPDRRSRMAKLLKQTFDEPQVRFLKTASEAIAALERDLDTCAIVSLDGDLSRSQFSEEGDRDPGTGEEVAAYLARVDAQCPVVVHTSDNQMAIAMMQTLSEGGCWCDRVVPEERWLPHRWLPKLRGLLTPIPSDRLAPEDVPNRDRPWGEIADFAAAFDPRDDWGSLEKARFVAEQLEQVYLNADTLPSTIAEVRTGLWAAQMLWRCYDIEPDDASMGYIGALLEQLRELLTHQPKPLAPQPIMLDSGDRLCDRIAGTLFGHAIGDALGLGLEGIPKERVGEYYPDGLSDYEDIVRDEYRSRWEPGEWTDDTALMLCIADSLLESNEVNLLDIARRFYRWAAAGHPGLGTTTHNVLFCKEVFGVDFFQAEFDRHYFVAAKKVWEESGGRSAPNGGLMRTSVVGIWDYRDRDRVKTNAERICQITHYDPRCVASCVALSLAVRALLCGTIDTENLTQQMAREVSDYHPEVKEYFQRTEDPDISTLQLGESWGMGYTLKTLSAGFWALQHAPSYDAGLLQVLHEGGDADTNGAVAGALLGAKFGYGSIPQRWIDGLKHRQELEVRVEQLVRRCR
ncbi:ADP-ribosylglycohydrolase family protein [Geitlerinema sp. CS-897]|nr:ADP-ribosylglycohydrolase family protein [Geitlerinema sp. CS-897]